MSFSYQLLQTLYKEVNNTNTRQKLSPKQWSLGWFLITVWDLPEQMRLSVLPICIPSRKVPVLQDRMKIFWGTWLLVEYFQWHALISDSQGKPLILSDGGMNVLNLTITCSDYLVTNAGGLNKLQSSPACSSKLSALTCTDTKHHDDKTPCK